MRHVSLFILEANISKIAKDLYLRLCFLFPLLFTTLIIPISVRNYLECNAMQFNCYYRKSNRLFGRYRTQMTLLGKNFRSRLIVIARRNSKW